MLMVEQPIVRSDTLHRARRSDGISASHPRLVNAFNAVFRAKAAGQLPLPSTVPLAIAAVANYPPIEQIAEMEISVIFDIAFQGRASGAVWIVESDNNRRWFERQPDLDAESAVFTPERGEIGREAILRAIWNVQEHCPDWSRISVSGAILTHELSTELRDEGSTMDTEQGFTLTRV
jgi:hypothetical protein